MARGNWRSGNGHGPAEVGSAWRVFDGLVMKVSGRYATSYEAHQEAGALEEDEYRTRITFGNTRYTVWRTIRKGQAKIQ